MISRKCTNINRTLSIWAGLISCHGFPAPTAFGESPHISTFPLPSSPRVVISWGPLFQGGQVLSRQAQHAQAVQLGGRRHVRGSLHQEVLVLKENSTDCRLDVADVAGNTW